MCIRCVILYIYFKYYFMRLPIKLWDLKKQKVIYTLTGHTDTVSALCVLSPRLLLSGSADTSLILWELRDIGYIIYIYIYIYIGNLLCSVDIDQVLEEL